MKAGLDRYWLALAGVLVVQAALYYSTPGERVRPRLPLAGFPTALEDWRMDREFSIEPAVQETLRADDVLSRTYSHASSGAAASLFIAYFQSQRTGQTPHSPKNCLPGSGFEPVETGFLDISVPGADPPIRVNRYVVSRGEERSVVLYWYQSHGRVVASEYWAKIWLVLDATRYRRSDTALIRVVVPVAGQEDEAATRTGADLIRCVFPALPAFLPS